MLSPFRVSFGSCSIRDGYGTRLTPGTAGGYGFDGKYELSLATGEIIVSWNDGFSTSQMGMVTLFSLPYDESSITTMTLENFMSIQFGAKFPPPPEPLATPSDSISSGSKSPPAPEPMGTPSDVPTPTPPPGYVGRGWCLDAQDIEYSSIVVDGSREIGSPHDCLDLCESIPVSDPSQLVGFQYDSKSLYGLPCFCLYTTLPDVTVELGNELGIRYYEESEGAGPVARSNDKDDSISCFSTSPVSSIS